MWQGIQGLFGNDKWDDGFRSDADAAKASLKYNLGPLIGNPQNPTYAGLRYAVDADTWFWPIELAPPAERAEIDAANAALAKKAADAEAATQAAAQAAADADAAAADEV